jgi:hypothetical protein
MDLEDMKKKTGQKPDMPDEWRPGYITEKVDIALQLALEAKSKGAVTVTFCEIRDKDMLNI